jgi:hypothetical protein
MYDLWKDDLWKVSSSSLDLWQWQGQWKWDKEDQDIDNINVNAVRMKESALKPKNIKKSD